MPLEGIQHPPNSDNPRERERERARQARLMVEASRLERTNPNYLAYLEKKRRGELGNQESISH